MTWVNEKTHVTNKYQQINPEKHDVFLRCAATDHDARANRKACHQMIGVLW